MSTERWCVTALLAVTLTLALFVTGCEVLGEYSDNNVHVQVGNTNQSVQAKGQ